MKPRLKMLVLLCVFSCLCLIFSLSGAAASTEEQWAPGDDDTDVLEAVVNVSDQVVADVHPQMFGNNLLAGYTYGDDGGGVWDPEGVPCSDEIIGCYNAEAFEILSDIHTGLLRFPGGRYARSYVWSDGVGPADRRKFYFGTDEFLFLSGALSASPVITVSLYDPETGDYAGAETIESAALWAEYISGTSPYGPATYWEIETDPWENSTSPFNPDIEYKRVPPEVYADALLEMSQALKSVDPNIQVGADAYDYRDVTDTYRLLSHIATSGVDPDYWPDFLTMGFYRPNFDRNRCDLYGVDVDAYLRATMATTFAASRELNDRLQNVLNAVDETWGEMKGNVPILLKEFNTQLLFAEMETNVPAGVDPVECPLRNLSHSLGAAIFNADVLLTALPYSDDVLSAAIYAYADSDDSMRGFYGSVYLHNGAAIQRPDALMLRMLGSQYHMEQVFQTSVVTSSFDNIAIGRTPAYNSIAIGNDENYIRVRVVRHAEPVDISLDCGPGNIYNPDTTSYINGLYGVDEFKLVQDDLPPDQQVNLMTNGSFDSDLTTGWTVNTDPTGVTTTRECDAGNCWLQLTFADGEANNPSYLEQVYQTVPVTPGERYSLSFVYRLDNLNIKTQNLLCDPSWEDTSVPGNYANTYWIQYGNTPSPATIVTEDCFEGDQCVEVPFIDNPDYYHIRQRYYIQNNADPELADPASYRVQGYIKTQNLDSAVTIEAQARNASDQYMQSADSYGVFGDTDWALQNYLFTLNDRANTAFINVHLRKKSGRKDNGVAWFDYVRMFRSEYNYAPRVVVDICQDQACMVKRTIETAGDYGSRDWTKRSLAGTPVISALAGRSGNNYSLILINKDLDRTVNTTINLASKIAARAGMSIYISRLTGDSVDATNELGDAGPDYHVFLSGGEYYGEFDGSSLTVDLPPYSITGLKIIDPTVPADDDWPDDDTDDDTIDDDDTEEDDDTAVDDDDTADDDDVVVADDDDDDDGCCGC